MRHLLAFLLLGTLLFIGRRALDPGDFTKPELAVHVLPSATRHEIEVAIDEAVLVERALASRSARVDPIVREQLLRSMRFEGVHSGDEDVVLDRAFKLGIHRMDPVVRQRLIFQARQVLRAALKAPKPTDAELQAYLLSHSERYREPPRRSFRQLFLSRTRHGKALAAATRSLAHKLRELDDRASEVALPSDPTLLPALMERVSEREIDARFGPDFGRAVFAATRGKYSQPIVSSYGVHFVLVYERIPETLPSLSALRQRLISDLLHDAQDRSLNVAVQALRAGYLIRIERGST